MHGQNINAVVNISQLNAACENCGLHDLRLPIGLDGPDMSKLERIVKMKKPLKRGEHLFHQGDSFYALYAIRSGSIKVYAVSEEGSEQFSSFLFPGDMTGMDAINTERHHSSAKALETTSYCKIPFAELEDLAGELPSLRHQLLRLMSKAIVSNESLLIQLGKKTAEERLASMLLSFSTRFRETRFRETKFRETGFSATRFKLSMSRSDIGNYLGLAFETVSRVF
jgi:CRP/FNR family transcriptional regulator